DPPPHRPQEVAQELGAEFPVDVLLIQPEELPHPPPPPTAVAWPDRQRRRRAELLPSPALNLIEYMKRVYDFSTISNRADFNGDGAVDSADQSDFNAAYALYSGQSGCNWVHGDLSGDNYVGAADVMMFNNWKLYHNNNPNDPSVLNAEKPSPSMH
ncbi:MAG: hypothetical protein IT435_11065, partial [Phycisphaerales bacterium]|nr:hypothetical protein [Phycisphaerales bacterium]